MGLFGVPCAGCARQIRIDADACWGCGRRIADQERAAEHARRVARGRKWIGWAALLFAASGLLGTFTLRKQIEGVVSQVELQAAGRDTTVSAERLSALRERVERRGLRIMTTNLGLAALFGCAWWWAQRGPVAALASSIALLLGVWIASGIIDRSTILDGFVLRLFALGAFAAGLRAALAARRAAKA